MPKRLSREQKLNKRKEKEEQHLQMMINTLKQEWKNDVNYTCIYCLKTAYNSVINGNKWLRDR